MRASFLPEIYLSIYLVTKQPPRPIGVSLTGDTVRAQPG
jgi:hypothetical protein